MRASENQLDHQVQVYIIMLLLSCSLQVTYVGTLAFPFKGISNKLFLLTLSLDFPFLPSIPPQQAAVTNR